MHDLSLNLFYKTTFDVCAIEGCDDLLWEIVCCIRGWMCGKYERRGISLSRDPKEWTAFKQGRHCNLGSRDGDIRFESASYWTSASSGDWACSITEVAREKTLAPREWKTEIGFHEESKTKGVLSVVLTYGDRAGFLGDVQDTPDETIPTFVWQVINHPHINCTISGVAACDSPIEVHNGEFRKFWSFVSDVNRSTPIVYISPRFDSDGNAMPSLIKPDEIVRMLGPSALVFYSLDKGFTDEMLYDLEDSSLSCVNGQVRVYYDKPRFDREGESRRHRFFLPRDIEAMGAERVLQMLRRTFAQNVDFYEEMVRVDEIRAKLRRQKYAEGASEQLAHSLADVRRQLSQVKEAAKADVETIENDAFKTLESMESELNQVRSELEAFAGDNDRLDNENRELKGDVRSLKQQNDSLLSALQEAGMNGGCDFDIGKWPLAPKHIASIYLAKYPDRICLTDAAFRSLDSCRSSSETIWCALYDLCTSAYDLYVDPKSKDITREFNARSKFTLVLGAGPATRKSNALMAGYEDEYKGRKIVCEAHLKSGSKESDPKFIRIYFHFDREDNIIVVSSVGEHKDTVATISKHVR